MNLEPYKAQLAKHGLTARYVPATDCSEDPQVEIWRGETDTRIAVQIGSCEETIGYYYPTEYGGEGDAMWSRGLGEFRSFKKAMARAIEQAAK